jgi:hypothetical protein
MKEIKELSTLEVNLYIQREQEPMFKQMIEAEANKNG